VIIVEEIKMNLLAKSCFAPGLIAMISNLIASAGEIDPEIMSGEWFQQYAEGMGHEIYRMQISSDDYPDQISFKKISEIAFTKFQAIVFGLEIQSKSNPEKSIVRLNPNAFQFTDWNLFHYHLYIICEDEEQAQKIQTLEMLEEQYERLLGQKRQNKDDPQFQHRDDSGDADAKSHMKAGPHEF